MEVIQSPDAFGDLEENSFVGSLPNMAESTIAFKGKGNVVYCEDGVVLQSSSITFEGDNGLLMLGRSKHFYKLDTSININCSLVIGRDVYFNGPAHVIVSEECSILIGDGCLMSFGVWFRTADPHLVFDAESHQRINYSKSIIVGDHVWIGQEALLLKGAVIGSGAIVGARSVVAGKTIPSNSSWGGNPARMIRDGIFWEGSCVHTWTSKKTKKRSRIDGAPYIYEVDSSSISQGGFSLPKGSVKAVERLSRYLQFGYDNGVHNRLSTQLVVQKRRRLALLKTLGRKARHS